MKTVGKIVKITAIVLLIIAILIILAGVLYAIFATKDVNLDKNGLLLFTNDLVLYDSDGNEIEFDSKLVRAVEYEDIAPCVIDAFVALEDKRFFKHNGLDYIRIAGAGINNIKAGYFKEGGSTITQQLAKNVVLTHDKTIERKLEEAKLAKQIESRYSKEEIITMYLNSIYFGHSLYGIAAASERLFEKKTSELTVAESALLAGIVKNPLKNSPLNSVENAVERRNLVLKLMFEQGYISESEYESALAETYSPPPEKEKSSMRNAYPYAVIDEACEILGISEKELITGGYTIRTYCNSEYQALCESICANDNLKNSTEERMLLLADNNSFGVVAYCSGIADSPFDFRRQPASVIKPIIAYAPAIELGYIAPGSPILDERCDFDGYSPQNYKNRYAGWITAREALINSSNVPAVKLMQKVGVKNAVTVAEKFGLTFDSNDGLASALGGMTYGVTPIEITRAYCSLANGGSSSALTFISSIIDSDGRIVYSHTPALRRAVSEETAYLVTDMLKDCARYGTAKKLAKFDYELCAKTGTNGTADGNSDAWCLSYTSNYSLCVWYGALNGAHMNSNVTGGSYPAMASKYVWENIAISDNFNVPNGIISADIDTYARNNSHIMTLASESTPDYYRKTELMNVKFTPAYSDYFDDALPHDFSVKCADNEIIISLTASDRFIYKIYERTDGVVADIQKGVGLTELALPTSFGLKSYVVAAYTTDGIKVAESNPRYIIVW